MLPAENDAIVAGFLWSGVHPKNASAELARAPRPGTRDPSCASATMAAMASSPRFSSAPAELPMALRAGGIVAQGRWRRRWSSRHPCSVRSRRCRRRPARALFTPGDTIDQTIAALIDGASAKRCPGVQLHESRIARSPPSKTGVACTSGAADRGRRSQRPAARDDDGTRWRGVARRHSPPRTTRWWSTPAARRVALVTGSYNFTSSAQFRNE
jgi:hypothetical protein